MEVMGGTCGTTSLPSSLAHAHTLSLSLSLTHTHTQLHTHNCTHTIAHTIAGGYESQTEGDSFIIAFHSAEDALLFSTDVQQALMDASWPQELLEHRCCQPIWWAGREKGRGRGKGG